MKQVNALLTICFIAAFGLLVASCSKEGPAGATGPAGPAGPGGAAGAAGPKGDTGVANVIYSAWLDAAYIADTFRVGGVLDTAGFYFIATVPRLTSAILSNGEIKVYMNFGTSASPFITPLPYTTASGLNISPFFYLSAIELDANANASTYNDTDGKHLQWRYILIPGGRPARSAVDWNNYEEVKKYLNLKD